jgi:hypothetical protein
MFSKDGVEGERGAVDYLKRRLSEVGALDVIPLVYQPLVGEQYIFIYGVLLEWHLLARTPQAHIQFPYSVQVKACLCADSGRL